MTKSAAPALSTPMCAAYPDQHRSPTWRNAMNVDTDIKKSPATEADPAPFFVRGKLVEGSDAVHRSRDLGVNFATPKIDLNALVQPRTQTPPLLNVKLAEIVDFLVESGQRLSDGKNPYVDACIERMARVSLQPRKVIEFQMKNATEYLDKTSLLEVVAQNF